MSVGGAGCRPLPAESPVPRDGSGASALRAGLHYVEPECAVVVDVCQDAKPGGNSRLVDPEGVVACNRPVLPHRTPRSPPVPGSRPSYASSGQSTYRGSCRRQNRRLRSRGLISRPGGRAPSTRGGISLRSPWPCEHHDHQGRAGSAGRRAQAVRRRVHEPGTVRRRGGAGRLTGWLPRLCSGPVSGSERGCHLARPDSNSHPSAPWAWASRPRMSRSVRPLANTPGQSFHVDS